MKTNTLRNLLFLGQFIVATAFSADAPPVVSLWTGDAPGSEGILTAEKVRVTEEGEHVVSSVHRPSLTVFLPPADKATGAAVVICPGGGHRELWMDHEGYNVGRWLADHGIAGFVLKYRLAREEGSTYKVEVASLADAQRAIQVVRSRAAEWGVDPARVGVIGFSAGGELAALTAMRFVDAENGAVDPVERFDSKPAFQALVYPGNTAAIMPTKDSPPAFFLCGFDDRRDVSEGIARVYLKFKSVDVPAELHIYTGTGHGFGVRARNTAPSSKWIEQFRAWLDERGFLGQVASTAP